VARQWQKTADSDLHLLFPGILIIHSAWGKSAIYANDDKADMNGVSTI